MFAAHERYIKHLADLYKRDLLGHAYIFFGPPRIGKADAARSLAAYLETGAWPKEDVRRPLTDVQVFSPDEKGAIGIDAARAVKAFLATKPFIGPRRVAIIDRAQALTSEAQNALLKIAEEPPESALLILVMPDPELLWPTLKSRFQGIYFPPLPDKEMRLRLKDGVDPLAARFFETPPAARKDFLKELTDDEHFNFAAFLDGLIAHLAAQDAGDRDGQLWHAVLELRRMQDATNLSPRIQLMNLWTRI